MDLTAWVDIAIGLVLVYLGASLFVTVINEYLAQIWSWRGKQLCASLKALINDEQAKGILAKSPALKPFFASDVKKNPPMWTPISWHACWSVASRIQPQPAALPSRWRELSTSCPTRT